MYQRRDHTHPDHFIQVRVQANTSYQIKKIMETIETGSGLLMQSRSGVKRNTGSGPKLREFATFRDLKAEKKYKKKYENENEQNQ